MMAFLAEKYILEEVRTLRQCRESTRGQRLIVERQPRITLPYVGAGVLR